EDVPVRHGLADADLGRFLADRDVQEARQLSCAKSLLDLLLEPANEQHLAIQLTKPLLGERALLPRLDLGHEPEFMLPAMTLVSQWRQIEAGLPADWEQAHLSLAVADVTRVDRAAALLGPLAPGRSQAELHFSAARAGWPGPEAVRRLLARLDAERIGGALVLTGAARGTAPRSAATGVAPSLA